MTAKPKSLPARLFSTDGDESAAAALTIITWIVSPLLLPIAAFDQTGGRWMRAYISRQRLRWALRQDRRADRKARQP